jgi:hypothetical protein
VLKIFKGKKVVTLTLGVMLVSCLFAMTALAAGPGTYTNDITVDASGNPIYFYSVTTGNVAPHAQDFVTNYVIDNDDNVTLNFKTGYIYGSPAYFTYFEVGYQNGVDQDGNPVYIWLGDLITPNPVPSTGTASATINAATLANVVIGAPFNNMPAGDYILVKFSTNPTAPANHTSTIYLKLDYLP